MDPGRGEYFDEEFDAELEEEIDRAFAALPDLEARVLDLYFGLHDEPLTLDEVARSLGLRVQEARDLKESALARLRRRGDGGGGAAIPARIPPRRPAPVSGQKDGSRSS